jgi:hypothetical protein
VTPIRASMVRSAVLGKQDQRLDRCESCSRFGRDVVPGVAKSLEPVSLNDNVRNEKHVSHFPPCLLESTPIESWEISQCYEQFSLQPV